MWCIVHLPIWGQIKFFFFFFFFYGGQIKLPLYKIEPGKRKRKEKERWEDNFRDWTGLDSNISQKAAKDCQRCQKIVADVSSGAPPTLAVPGHR